MYTAEDDAINTPAVSTTNLSAEERKVASQVFSAQPGFSTLNVNILKTIDISEVFEPPALPSGPECIHVVPTWNFVSFRES